MPSQKRARRTLPDSPEERNSTRNHSPELGSGSENPYIPAVLQPVQEVHIALDTGTESTKASYLTQFSNQGDDRLPAASPEEVMWPGCKNYVRSQLAFTRDGRMLWGDEVDQELKKGGQGAITESQVIRYLKPALFDNHTAAQTPFQEGIRVDENRKTVLHNCLISCGEDPRDFQLENISMFSDFMGFAYRYVLQYIAQNGTTVRWKVFKNLDDYKGWEPPGNARIHVALPVPVGSSSRQVQVMVAAAKAAGIPNPYPVAEPAAALIHHLDKTRGGQSRIGKTFLILDIGAGSADQQIWTVVDENPLRVRELVIPERVKTIWCGGSSTNKKAVSLIKSGIRNMDRVLQALQRNRSSVTDVRSLERKLYKRFEEEKTMFTGGDTMYLKVSGLPDIPEYGLCGGDRVVLQAGDVKRAFATCLDGITHMLDTAIKSVVGRRTLRGTVEQRIDEIIMVGGCSQNAYLLDQIRNRYSGGVQSPFPDVIPVTRRPEAAKGAVTVAHGAALLSAEKELIKERFVRRSFCVEWSEEVADKSAKRCPKGSVQRSPQDLMFRMAVTKFLLRSGLYPQRFSCTPLQGWRGLMLEDKDGDGWTVEERLRYSDTVSGDGLWIDNPDLDITEMPVALTWRISFEEAQRFPRNESPERKVWWYVDYEVVLELDGEIMTFKFIIPKSGRWPTHGDRYADVTERIGRYTTTGVSQLVSSTRD